MFQNLGQKVSKEFIFSLGLGLLAALIGSFAVVSFVMPAEYWGGNLAVRDNELLKTSLGVKAYGKLEVFEFLDKALPSATAVYRKKPASSQAIDNLYLAKDRLGYGFILTSDGWIISNKSVVDGNSAKGLAVGLKGKIYEAEFLVFDTWTDAIFIKIDAADLPVAPLGDSGALKLGDIIFSGKNKNNFLFSYIASANLYPDKFSKSDLVISSEKFGKVIKLQDGFPAELNGGLAANGNGEIVGLIVSNQKDSYILPANYFKNIVSGVLRNKKAARPYLGVNYIDLSGVSAANAGQAAANAGPAAGGGFPREQGAYLYGGGFAQAVEVGSPAYKAGLKAGDIILAIDGENINDSNNMAEKLSDYRGGEEITIKFLRGGKEQEAKAALGSK